MFRFLQSFDRISFWLGFLAASLFWWIVNLLKPWIRNIFLGLQEKSQLSHLGATVLAEIRLQNDILRFVQNYHLAAPLFSLEEIAITPRLLAPPPLTEPGIIPPEQDIVESIVPYLPDRPEIASYYNAPSFTLIEALKGSANFMIVGQPGSGKSVALAHLAIQIIRKENIPNYLQDIIPLLIHAADIPIVPDTAENSLEPLASAVSYSCPSLPHSRLEPLLASLFSDGRALLLLDGLDELPAEEIAQYVKYLENVLKAYPKTRVIAAASPYFYDGLPNLDFVPLVISSWCETERSEFIHRWSDLWMSQISDPKQTLLDRDPILLNAWLIHDNTILSPFELVLKVWGVYAGDLQGPRPMDWIEAYLQRLGGGISDGRSSLELLARQALNAQKAVFHQKDAENWMRDHAPISNVEVVPEAVTVTEGADWPPPVETQKNPASMDKSIHDTRALSPLFERGLLIPHRAEQFGFCHPLIFSYLAGSHMASYGWSGGAFVFDNWSTLLQSLGFLTAKREDAAPLLRPYLEDVSPPLFQNYIISAEWLHFAPDNISWRTSLMRHLSRILQSEEYPLGLRSRALGAIVVSGTPGVDSLFRQLLTSPDHGSRLLGALGCGLLRDSKSVNDLKSMFKDPQPNVRRGACLALVAIGQQYAMEAVAELLLHGDEDQRRSAAEALANHPEEGYPTLQEGALLDDILVRRAVVHGLRRLRHPWSRELLEKMQVSDSQWVVKDAATTALTELTEDNPRLPKAMPELTETPWLIAFAGERGIGLSPGKPALDLVLLALQEGKEEQRLAALDYLARHHTPAALPIIYQVYNSSKGEIRESAFYTLWQAHCAGSEFNVG